MSGGSRVYVGRLSYQTREKDIERFFRGYGRLTEVNLKNGFGFVEFEDSRDADDAVYELNGRELFGERLIVEHARGPGRRRDRGDDRYGGGGGGGGGGYRDGPRRGGFDRYGSRGGQRQNRDGDKYGPPVRTEYRLIVENLSSKVSWQDLKDYVRQAGEVTFADAHKQRKNEGIVEFSSRYDMENAIKKLDNTELNGRKIRLVEDRPSRKRSHSRSRSRSRHRSRSRSRSRSNSRSRSHSRSRSKSKSPKRSKSKSRSKSRSRSKSKSKSRSRSPPPKKSRSRSPSPKRDDEKKSPEKSPARSKSRSRSKSQSPSKDD